MGVCPTLSVFPFHYSLADHIACADGLFGEQCEYTCHCEGNGRCNKTGVCINDKKCATGWAGTDCQQGI